MSTATALKSILTEKLKNDDLVLPTLPKIALKVREAVADPDATLNTITGIIAQDVALTARLICIANTAYYSRVVRVDNLHTAVTRIGMRQIKNIVMVLSMEQLFISNNEFIATYLAKQWHTSTEVASYAMALFSHYQANNKHTPLQFDTLCLCALLHNIGSLPILTEADSYPDVFSSPDFVEKIIGQLQNDISLSIVQAWNFSPEMAQGVYYHSRSDYETKQISYLDFIRLALLCKSNEGSLLTCEEQLMPFVEKGLLSDIAVLESDFFRDELNTARETFI